MTEVKHESSNTVRTSKRCICIGCVVVLLQISDYPSGVAVISGGFGRLVSAKFTDDSSHS